MSEYAEGGRSLEEIVRNFTINFEIYNANLADTGLIPDPDEVFKYSEHPARAELLSAVAVYYSLPESFGERKRLIDEAVAGSAIISESARRALKLYAINSKLIRKELGRDWRNVLAERLTQWKIARDDKEALEQVETFPPELGAKLDAIMKYIPLPIEEYKLADLFVLVDKGVRHALIRKEDGVRLRTYLEEFIMTLTDKRF